MCTSQLDKGWIITNGICLVLACRKWIRLCIPSCEIARAGLPGLF